LTSDYLPQQDIFGDNYRNSYNVSIEAFEGPLDLLLHLIKKNEVDIYNIPIAAITRQYLEYLEMMKELNLDYAGDFLVMASTLIQIKSRMLLPAGEDDESSEEEEDPRAELVKRLIEYRKYKEAAQNLVERELLGRDIFARKFAAPELVALQPEEEPPQVEMFELIEALQRLLAKVPVETFHEVGVESISITERITEILVQLEGKEMVTFEDLFAEVLTREYIIATFLAVLELCRLKLVKLAQGERCGSIWVMPAVIGVDGEESREEDGAHEP
jgi:segregation and condensation protein A